MKLKTLDFDVVIVGCGIAGMTSAIYLKRSNLNVCMIEKNAPGGQLNMINEINNYPGFESIDGPTLAFNVFNQIKKLEIPYKYANALEIIDNIEYKTIKTDKEEITCKNVVIATGRRPRELGLQNEKRLLGKGISYCSICDGTLYKDKVVAVVGGGNSAIESALYLSEICQKVYLIHRTESYRAENTLMDNIKEKENIELIKNAKITELKEKDDKLSSVIINDGKEIKCNGLFINVGNVPIPIKCKNLKLEENYIVVDNKMESNIEGIYACGDIIKKDVYQITTAISEGTIAAINIIKKFN